MDDAVEFIKLLKSQHRSIVATIHEIDNQPGGATDLKNSVEKLNMITGLLFDHLEKEDKVLYPALLNNKDTSSLAKKYSYDMERLSCIAVDFFKRYCVNREGLKIFVEDFINGYLIFKGLLKIRIKREETELYPAFILLQSGVLHSDVLDFVKGQEEKNHTKQKRVFLFAQNQSYLDTLALTLEMAGYQVCSTHSVNEVSSLAEKVPSDLILVDVTSKNKELTDLIVHLRESLPQGVQIVGYSPTKPTRSEETIKVNLDQFIPQAVINVEEFSEKINQILTR